MAEVRRTDTEIDTDLRVEALKSAICNIEEKGHSVGLCYNSISFPKYDGNDISHMQQNDPILGRFLYYFTSGKKPSKKERSAENKLVIQMLRQRDRMFLDKNHVLCRVVKDPQAGELKQLALPACLREQVMDALHTQAGHQGIERTIGLIRARFYWTGMYSDVTKFCKTCERCCISKLPQPKISLPMDHLLASEPNQIVAMDFTILEKASDGRENVLVMTDVFSKFTVAIPTRDQTANTTAKVLLREVHVIWNTTTSTL